MIAKMFKVTYENGETREVAEGTTIETLANEARPTRESVIIAAKVDNTIQELTKVIDSDCSLRFLDLSNSDGARIYERSLTFMLVKAVKHLYANKNVRVKHSVSVGIYAEITNKDDSVTDTGFDVSLIEEYMRRLASMKIPFIRKRVDMADAAAVLDSSGRHDLYNAIKERNKGYVIFYDFDGLLDYFYGYMAPHSGYITKFSLINHPPGVVVMYPNKYSPVNIPHFDPQPKLTAIFSEYNNWGRILGVENVGALNELVNNGEGPGLIRIAEALQEKKIAQIADMITGSSGLSGLYDPSGQSGAFGSSGSSGSSGRSDLSDLSDPSGLSGSSGLSGLYNPTSSSCHTGAKRIVLISGPTSSGKTTFANRLSIQLRVNGFKTHAISMDDYFLNREDTPLDENGEYDYESPDALDIDLFISQMTRLAGGGTVEAPIFSFLKGGREDYTRTITADDNHIIIVEGIHGLNTIIANNVPKESCFRIYISALTALNIDDHNRIPTTDTRLIRRIVRDNQFRGSSAIDTIKRWPSVRRGEKKYIFPYQETCDIMFNSALIYELGVLKAYAMPLLESVDPGFEQYSEANRLVKFLSYFKEINEVCVPQNSILKEFIGGSCFNV